MKTARTKFNLVLSDVEPKPTEQISDSFSDDVEVRRARLIGDLAIECIHAHAFLNNLNVTTNGHASVDKIHHFVLNHFIKKTAQLHNDLDTKKTIMSSVKFSLETLKNECEHPDFDHDLDRLCLDSTTKYNDLLNADIVYLATNEKIKFANYAKNRDMGFSTIITREVTRERDEDVLRDKVVVICEKWIDALYGEMAKHSNQKKGGAWDGGLADDQKRNRSWFAWACDTIGDAFIAVGGYIKVSKPDETDKKSDNDNLP